MRICTLFLLSSCSPAHGLNPLLFYERRRCPIKFSHFRFNLLTKPRFFTCDSIVTNLAVSATENGVFTSPEIARSFDFSSEERIYNWWESQGIFKPSFDRGSDPFVVSMLPPNVTGSLHMGHELSFVFPVHHIRITQQLLIHRSARVLGNGVADCPSLNNLSQK